METLTSLEIYRASDSTKLLDIPLIGRGPDDRYRIVDIEGLGPVESSLSTSKYAGKPGVVFGSAQDDPRTIVLNIEYISQYTEETSPLRLRRDLYSILPPSTPVELWFRNGTADAEARKIVGYVESHQPVIFTDRPQVSVSILCVDPYFERFSGILLSGTTGTPKTTLPYIGDAPSEFRISLAGQTGFKRVEISDGIHEPYIWGVNGTFTNFAYDSRLGSRGVWTGGSLQFPYHISGDYLLSLSTRNPEVTVKTFTTVTGNTQTPVEFQINLVPKFLGF